MRVLCEALFTHFATSTTLLQVMSYLIQITLQTCHTREIKEKTIKTKPYSADNITFALNL